ncbi:rhomboid family intramembrane serine protease [Lysobacter enzymogenes]|uniref:rhomboid family intramembrane serine protease n=1 Tax=Lysobacter enzymogenes TaxID=69 RepID=UPI00099DCA88
MSPLAVVLLSVFSHASLGHLASNVAMLLVVAPRVLCTLQWWRFGLLFLVSGLVANAGAAALLDRPVIGSSGAVAGVMAAYLALFPRERVSQLIGLWIALQFVFALVRLDFGDVAWPAHIVGAIAGASLSVALRWGPSRRGACPTR